MATHLLIDKSANLPLFWQLKRHSPVEKSTYKFELLHLNKHSCLMGSANNPIGQIGLQVYHSRSQ